MFIFSVRCQALARCQGAIPRLDARFECHAGAYRCQIKVEYHRDPLRALCHSVYFLVSDVQSLDYSVHAARLRRRKIVYQKRIPTCRCHFFTSLFYRMSSIFALALLSSRSRGNDSRNTYVQDIQTARAPLSDHHDNSDDSKVPIYS